MGCDATIISRHSWLSLFQSTHPHGVRRFFYRCYFLLRCFNPRTRMGCDFYNSTLRRLINVSIHAPAWGATVTNALRAGVPIVSIHAPAWGATFKSMAIINGIVEVSIHAPAWGATSRITGDIFIPFSVSIHAPAWGATARPCFCAKYQPKFQSTHPHGVRPKCTSLVAIPMLVSIHAPAWGATVYMQIANILIYTSSILRLPYFY